MNGRDPFEWWYSVTEVARRLGKHPRTVKRAVECGQFGPRPGEAGFLGRWVCGELHLPWRAVALFLKLPTTEAGPEQGVWRARSEGELRRKVEASKRVDEPSEVAHG